MFRLINFHRDRTDERSVKETPRPPSLSSAFSVPGQRTRKRPEFFTNSPNEAKKLPNTSRIQKSFVKWYQMTELCVLHILLREASWQSTYMPI